MLGRIEDGDTWLLTGHRAEGSAPFHNVYRIIAGRGSSAEPRAPLQVRVVPNPYVMFDEWESSTWQRQVRFTRLPSRCTIRVYTVSGDLVRVLEHTDTRSQPQDQGGTELWDLTSDGHLVITSGVYVFHVQSDVGECAGRLAVIR
jgi:hypothetical protein